MFKQSIQLLALLSILSLSACGQSGPLYFPETVPQQLEQD